MAKGLNCLLPLRTHKLWGNMTNNTSNAHIPEWNNLAPVINTDSFQRNANKTNTKSWCGPRESGKGSLSSATLDDLGAYWVPDRDER